MTKRSKWLSVEVGKVLATRRNELKVTQAELAKTLRIQRTSVSNIESGKQVMMIDLFYDICSALNLSPIATLEEASHYKEHTMAEMEPLSEINQLVKDGNVG